MSKFLEFIEDKDGITVLNKKHKDILGVIRFYQPWGQYVFEPFANSIFSSECMRSIVKKIQDKNRLPF